MDTGHNPARALDATARARRQELGARLDAAEDYAYASGELHDDHDFEVDNVLHHDSLACPWCRLREIAHEYRAALRAPVLARPYPKLKFRTSKETNASYVALRLAYGAKLAAAAFYEATLEFDASARARIDAAVEHERTEGDWYRIGAQIETYERERSIRKAERRAGIVRTFPHRRMKMRVAS